MPADSLQKKALVFGAAAALRLLLFIAFPALPDLLTGRVEISTPVTSFKRLQEGLYLYTRNVSPYDGGIFHQAPLILPIFSLLPSVKSFPLVTDLVYIVADLLSANALMQLAETGENVSTRLFTSPRRQLRWSSLAIAAGFLFNPFTIATCVARPTSVFTNSFILHSIAAAASGRSLQFVLAISFASYLSLFPMLLFPPLCLLCWDHQQHKTSTPTKQGKPSKTSTSSQPLAVFSAINVGTFVGIEATLLIVSWLVTGSWEFLSSTYGVQLLLPDLTPNVGLWWYFFIEMFDSFREFFLGVFWLHMASYVGGLSVRFRTQPLFVIVTLLGLFAIFQPYPSIADSTIYLALLPLYRHVFPLMRYTFIAIAALLYATFLGPAFYHLWVYAGSGNANFFYAITLVWCLGLSIVVADSLYAVLRDEWEVERPDMKGKEAVRI